MFDDKLAIDKRKNEMNQERTKTNLNVGIGVEIPAQVPRLTMKKRPKFSLAAAQISKFVDFIYFSLYGLLAARLLLVLFAEKDTGGLVVFIKNIVAPFCSPFQGIFTGLSAELGIVSVFPVITAFFFYMFLYLIINGVLTLMMNRKKNVVGLK